MRRREFIRLIGLSPVWPLKARAQQSTKIAKIGVLWHAGSADEERVYLDTLTKALANLGYIEGKNVTFIHRFPGERIDRYHSLAQELIDSDVDVVVAVTLAGAIALQQVTNAVPIVFVTVPDPVGSGLVVSLAHPGGNLTGLSIIATDTSGKRLSLFKEAVPTLSRVAVLVEPLDPVSSAYVASYSNAAKALDISLQPIAVRTPEAIEPVFLEISADGFDGAIVHGGLLSNEGPRVGASALAHRMPTVSIWAEKVPYGLLMSYGQDVYEILGKTAVYVTKILKGAKPADLPVEQPTRLKLAINLKAASVLGLIIPPALLASADEVIE
jgi:putative ABC transport system substrate-binding protein